jgi:hypothetical protein
MLKVVAGLAHCAGGNCAGTWGLSHVSCIISKKDKMFANAMSVLRMWEKS